MLHPEQHKINLKWIGKYYFYILLFKSGLFLHHAVFVKNEEYSNKIAQS